MATTIKASKCAVCNRDKFIFPCQGCSKGFCIDHLAKHRTDLSEQLDQIENDHGKIDQDLIEHNNDLKKHPVILYIDQWEKESIEKIKQTAERCRKQWEIYSAGLFLEVEGKLNDLGKEIRKARDGNAFDEIHINRLKENLEKIQKEYNQPTDVYIEEQETLFLDKIALRLPLRRDARWDQQGMTIAGKNGHGHRLDQLSSPFGIYIDDDNESIYIADYNNARILEWKANARSGRIVAGGNGSGNRTDQLEQPTDVIVDRQNNSVIIADGGNRRVIRWSRQTTPHGQIIISDIDCWGLTVHKDGSFYVSDCVKNEVRRWKKGQKNGTLVAGGNGQGNHLKQLSNPTHLFVTDDHTLYVSDRDNHRVMKWVKGAKQGVVVAGGNDRGDCLTELSYPRGVMVDVFNQIYVADHGNNRIVRWAEGATAGTIVVGGNGKGRQGNQLFGPVRFSFDREGNLYVADCLNNRIQKFMFD